MVSGDNLSDTIVINDPYLTMPLVVDGGDATDFIRLESRGGGLTTLSGGNGDDFFDFSFSAHNLANVGGFTNVFGGAGNDSIFLYDNANSQPATYQAAASFIYRVGLNGVQYASDVEGLTLTTGTAADTVNVTGTSAGTPLYVTTAAGQDTVNVGGGDGLSSIAADVQIQNASLDLTTLNINDTGDGTARNATIDNTNNGFGDLYGMAPSASIFWNLNNISRLNLTSGNLADTVNLIRSGGVAITFDSAGGNDAVKIGNGTYGMSGINNNIKVLNSNGLTDVTLDDSGSSAPKTITHAPVSIGGFTYERVTGTWNPVNIDCRASQTNSMTINTSSVGGNTINIVSGGSVLNIIGHAGLGPHDIVNIGNPGTLSQIAGIINISNPPGYDDININDYNNFNSQTFTLSTFFPTPNDAWGKVAFTNFIFPAEINYHIGDTKTVTLSAGYGGVTANISDVRVPTTISAPALGHLTANVAGTIAPLTISQYGSGASGVSVFLGSSPSYGNGVGNVQGINGAVTITSSDASVVTVDDSGDTTAHNATLSSTQLANLAPATITYPSNCGLVVYGSSVNTAISEASAPSVFEFDGGPSTDTVNIESVTGSFTVNGGGGVDFINVTPQGGNLDAIPGTLTLNASYSSYLNINDQNNPNNITNQDFFSNTGISRYDYHYVFVGSPPIPVLQPYVVGLSYSGFGNITFNGPSPVTSYIVPSTAAGTSLTINEGAGAPTTIGDTGAHSLLSIVSPVTINSGGASTISLDDSGVSSPVTVHVNPTQVGATPGDNLFGAGGSLTYSVSSLSLATPNASAGDKVYVRPSPSTSMTINGGNPTTAPGDVLTLADADAISPQLTPNGIGAGQYTFLNRQPVTFTGFESSVQDAVTPSIGSASFQFGTSPQSLVFTANENLIGPTGSLAPFSISRVSPFAFISVAGVSYLNNTIVAAFSGVLADGNYHAHVVPSGITDVPGNVMSANFDFDFFVLAADANHDRIVNTSDFTILAQNFNKSNASFNQGDFNYDGKVNALDFNLLATHFGTSLAPAASLPNAALSTAPPVAASRVASLFSDTRLTKVDNDSIESEDLMESVRRSPREILLQ
jgi:hypothetical protein